MISPEQARFFARNGFLQLRGLIPEATCAHLVERTWEHLPPHWRRDDPTTWRGQVEDSCHVASLDARGGLLKFVSACSGRISAQRRELQADPRILESYHEPSVGHGAAHRLIGRPLHPIRLRGLYAIAPVEHPDAAREVPSPHIEAHAAQIVSLTYLDDVDPGGGGLLVWPGSHRELYPAFTSKFDYVAGLSLQTVLNGLLRRRPIELSGERGDLILTHHRLLHSPGINRLDRIRFAFLCDYTPKDHVALCRQAPGDLWEDWPGLVALAGSAGLDGAPDFATEPAPEAPAPADPAPERRGWRRLLGRRRRRASAESACSRNKLDASRIGRDRRPGEVWLSLADSPDLYDDTERLDPRGGRLVHGARGVRVHFNGARLTSVSHNGFTARLDVRPGANALSIRGVRRPLWLRILAVESPISASRVPLRRALDGRRGRLDLVLDHRTLAAAGGQPLSAAGR